MVEKTLKKKIEGLEGEKNTQKKHSKDKTQNQMVEISSN